VGTTVNDWPSDQHEVFNAEFYDNGAAIEVHEEPTWRDLEDAAGDTDEIVAVLTAPEEEQEEEQGASSDHEYLRRQQRYADLDKQLDAVGDAGPFNISPTMNRPTRAFFTVVSTFFNLQNRTMTGISKYNGEQRGTRRVVKPSTSDFIVDVELAARRALAAHKNLQRVFDKHIVELEGTEWEKVPLMVRSALVELVGKEFVRSGIFPCGAYFHG
jgi:hypothetical protein